MGRGLGQLMDCFQGAGQICKREGWYATWLIFTIAGVDSALMVLSPDADRQIPDGSRWPVFNWAITAFVVVFLCSLLPRRSISRDTNGFALPPSSSQYPHDWFLLVANSTALNCCRTLH